MKKIKILCLLMLTVVLCTSCGGKKGYGLDPRDPQSIVVWNYYNGSQLIAFENMVEEFNSTIGKENGIVVYAESKGSVPDLLEALSDAADKKVGAEAMPNVFQCYLDMAVEIDENDVLVNLDDYVSKDVKETYYDAYIEEGTFGADNAWKLFPVAKSTEVFMINKTDWDRFAADTGSTVEELSTWEGCVDVAERYYNWSGGKAFMGRDAFANYIIVGSKQLGTELFAVTDGKVTLQFEEQVMRRLWDNYYVPFVKGYFGQKGRYRSDDIKLGELIAMISSSAGASYFPTEVTGEDGVDVYPIDYMVLPVPNFEGTENYAVQQGASMAVARSNARAEYASVVFLEWFTETEQNMEFVLESSYMPVKKENSNIAAYEAYVTEHGLAEEGITSDIAKICFDQTENSHLFTSKGFVGANDARTVLNTTMIDLAVADRESIVQEIAAGVSEEEALAQYLSDEHFEQWYRDTKQQLEAVMQ